jgi:pyrimidine-specific ribonucleoside hydrolase
MRAITMLLASPDVRVLAITVTPGVLNTENSYLKVKSLLNSLFHEGVPVGVNKNLVFKSPLFQTALNSKWGNEDEIDQLNKMECIDLIKDIISVEKTRITFVCLGGLTTVYSAINNIPLFREKVREIIWSANGLNDKKGFNYNIDKESADRVFKETIPVRVVKSFGEESFFNEQLISEFSRINTPYSKKICSFFSTEIAKNHVYAFRANDEMIPIFIHYPGLFKVDSAGRNFDCTPADKYLLRESSLKILKGETVSKNQVIKELPADPLFYSDDIKPSVKEIIEKFGMDEWSSGVIANELHRHLGVFAIVGVKMGIRAREYFNTGVDEFRVTSFAGSIPPLSCMNDGLQVSTGATPGHGLLTVINDSPTRASAEFSYLNNKIRLTLKPEIAQKITGELKEINFINGLDSNIYWELVRKNSIKYWLNLDRHEIFTIEILE